MELVSNDPQSDQGNKRLEIERRLSPVPILQLCNYKIPVDRWEISRFRRDCTLLEAIGMIIGIVAKRESAYM